MSTTATFTTPAFVGVLPTMTSAVSDKYCPTCGHDGTLTTGDSGRRIQELEGQVQYLNAKAQDAANKLAEYEDEVRRLRSHADSSLLTVHPRSSAQPDPEKPLPPSPHPQQNRLTTFTSFLPSRRNSSTPTSPQFPNLRPDTGSQDAVELKDALNREQNLRKAAESQLSQANTELEELTAQLFSQANEMVAQERRARAKLEERVTMLERRDIEKRARLERLEKAMERVERLRKLVG